MARVGRSAMKIHEPGRAARARESKTLPRGANTYADGGPSLFRAGFQTGFTFGQYCRRVKRPPCVSISLSRIF